jgi:putative zinc finger/helix-turn-helix YgiT family protein
MKCAECGATMHAIEKKPYHYVESGLDNVYLYGIDEYRCPKCSNEMVRIPRPLQLNIMLAIAISQKEGRLTGAEVRFLRKEIGMNGKAFAEAVGVNPVSLSRWENDKESQSESHDRLIRYVFRFMLQKQLQTMIDRVEDALRQAEIISFKNKRVDVNADQMRYITIPNAAVCEKAAS